MKPHTIDPLPRLGTCGWSYDEWEGALYPRNLPAHERLAFYARFFDAIEVDSTFYHAPAPHVVRTWRDETPPHFRFACKIPRAITQEARLRNAVGEAAAFADRMSLLGSRLACLLVQLPPSLHPSDSFPDLQAFLAALPSGVQWAVEFRNPAWHTPDVVDVMQTAGAAWVWHDMTAAGSEDLAAFELQPATGELLYVRLLGGGDTHRHSESSVNDVFAGRDASLDAWVPRIARETAASGRPAWIFAANHYEGFAPATCRRLARRFGLEIALPTRFDLGTSGSEEQIELL